MSIVTSQQIGTQSTHVRTDYARPMWVFSEILCHSMIHNVLSLRRRELTTLYSHTTDTQRIPRDIRRRN